MGRAPPLDQLAGFFSDTFERIRVALNISGYEFDAFRRQMLWNLVAPVRSRLVPLALAAVSALVCVALTGQFVELLGLGREQKGQLCLRCVDGLGLLAEQMSSRTLELERYQLVQLLVFVALVARASASRLRFSRSSDCF